MEEDLLVASNSVTNSVTTVLVLLMEPILHYTSQVTRESKAIAVPVCFNAFTSVYGITKARIERIRKSLATTGYW
ncbi:hypothetical protein RRG08_042948 [Elysia crispata]|uniref:Uncharacterized protein n=1 Tax=Elysia crispata TaxID=231223 RepID=A0AAE1AXP6_9GAST|nr:hypothetical protein RRG08_042948 [Elysia crispata]